MLVQLIFYQAEETVAPLPLLWKAKLPEAIIRVCKPTEIVCKLPEQEGSVLLL